jgi:hypothetical protein
LSGLPQVSRTRVVRALERAGFVLLRQARYHHIAVTGSATREARSLLSLASTTMAAICLSHVGCGWGPFSSKACTTIGCSDQFGATVIASSTELPAGTHTLTVTTEAGTLSCSFVVPFETLPGGGTAVPQCQPGLGVFVGLNTLCTETVTAEVRTLRCDPIPGQLKESISISGTPTSVRVQQSVGGTTILDRSVSPTYKANRPNGPECDPLCRQAAVEWTIP